MARALFVELKLLYANSVWIPENNVKVSIWKLYMIFEENKELMENLSLHKLLCPVYYPLVGPGSCS